MEQISWEEVGKEKDALLIVNCTRTNIWDICPNAPEKLPAMVAYQGSSFREFLFQIKKQKIDLPWVILSGKYGFIEPCTLISNYNVRLGTKDAISFEELRRQVHERTVGGRPLSSFRKVFLFTKDQVYMEAVEYAFRGIAKCFFDYSCLTAARSSSAIPRSMSLATESRSQTFVPAKKSSMPRVDRKRRRNTAPSM